MLTHKAFSFSAEGKDLDATISRITQALSVGAGSPILILASVKKKLKVIGLTQDAFVLMDVSNSSSDSDGCFAFTAADLQGVVKNRPVLDFKYNGNELSWSKARYTGSLATIPITEDQDASVTKFASAEKSSAIELPADAIKSLREAISLSAITDVVGNTKMLSYVTMDKAGELSVSSFSNQHFSMVDVSVGVKGSPFRIALPQLYFSIINTVADGRDGKFYFSKSNIRVAGKGFTLVMPATQAEDHHFSMVKNFVQALGKPQYSAKFEHAHLKVIIDNLYTLFKASSFFEFSTKSGSKSVAVKLSTATGKASDSFQVDVSKANSLKAEVDPRLFCDIFKLLSSAKDLEFAVTPKVLYLQGAVGPASIFVACAQHKENA